MELLFCRLEIHVDTPLADARSVATAMTSTNSIRGRDSVAAAGPLPAGLADRNSSLAPSTY